ncbi:MAG TPA: hypothetical protein VKT82_06290 [Ktedonobacterales bacterium]|nr:hypothetical protein [Ktedonobacterales bacterium]
MISRQHLFRSQALEHYARSREKTVLPRVVTPPVFLCCWLLLGLLLLATTLAWQAQVPIYAAVGGAVLETQPTSQQTTNGLEAIIFVPATPAPQIHVGDQITLAVVLTGETFTGTIATVEPGVMTPDDARQRYALSGDLALVITQPSVVVQVALRPMPPADVTAGLSITTQVQVGAQSVFSLLPTFLSGFLGG